MSVLALRHRALAAVALATLLAIIGAPGSRAHDVRHAAAARALSSSGAVPVHMQLHERLHARHAQRQQPRGARDSRAREEAPHHAGEQRAEWSGISSDVMEVELEALALREQYWAEANYTEQQKATLRRNHFIELNRGQVRLRCEALPSPTPRARSARHDDGTSGATALQVSRGARAREGWRRSSRSGTWRSRCGDRRARCDRRPRVASAGAQPRLASARERATIFEQPADRWPRLLFYDSFYQGARSPPRPSGRARAERASALSGRARVWSVRAAGRKVVPANFSFDHCPQQLVPPNRRIRCELSFNRGDIALQDAVFFMNRYRSPRAARTARACARRWCCVSRSGAYARTI
eukprot:scaffold843_cov327-Prasinococcus_capsulatus_cf.AAC.22